MPKTTGSGFFKDIYSIMAKWGANHGAISHGHIGVDLISLDAMLCIPVNMHNVTDDDVFRPSAWSVFGENFEGADYRACEDYKPLYGFKAYYKVIAKFKEVAFKCLFY